MSEQDLKLTEIVSDDEIAKVHGYANFGSMTPREVVNDGVRKTAVGYHCGHTQFTILREHGLITKPRAGSYDADLTKKGKAYGRALYHAERRTPPKPSGTEGVTEINAVTAFEIGYAWRGQLMGQTLEDSRAVGRTLQGPLFDGLAIDLSGWNSFEDADLGICDAKRRITAALAEGEKPAPGGEPVAWRWRWNAPGNTDGWIYGEIQPSIPPITVVDRWRKEIQPLYTTPTPPTAGSVQVSRAPSRKLIEDLAREWGYTVEEASESYQGFLDVCARHGLQDPDPAAWVSPEQLTALLDKTITSGVGGHYLPIRKSQDNFFTQPLYAEAGKPCAGWRADLQTVLGWLQELPSLDMADIAADGGVTVGMVVQQEAREMAGRLQRAISAGESV